MANTEVVFHTATLHKPHIISHSKQSFVDVNISGTLTLLEEAKLARVLRFIFTSSTSVYGDALVPPPGEPAAWITEDLTPVPKNIYGVTKCAAEDMCQLFQRNHSLPCTVLRTSRFFIEDDDNEDTRKAYSGENSKTIEFTHRRVDIADVVSAHVLAMTQEVYLGFRKYIISATTPFSCEDLVELRKDASAVIRRVVPGSDEVFAGLGWSFFPSIDRVYVNTLARTELGWTPQYSFHSIVDKLRGVGCGGSNSCVHSELALSIGDKGYHKK
jgi:UDP-glucose 4-epimerase